MPAIQPDRLKRQATLLAEYFPEPEAFSREMHGILEQYSNRTYRHGQAGEPPPMISTYNVPSPVLRQISLLLVPYARSEPQQALALCDKLWSQPYFEFRLLTSNILGYISPIPVDAITNRIQSWIKPETEEQLIDALLSDGLIRLRKERFHDLIQLIEKWLNSNKVFYQKLGLRALLPISLDPDQDNLPILYRLIQPLIQNSSTDTHPELLDVLEAMTNRSPKETAFFLNQTMYLTNSPDTQWFIRQLLERFPMESQVYLRASMIELGRS
ncbi:DNA alkylation repair protein [Chloroflexota bacterium]